MENVQINLQLPLQWVNLALAALAKQPLEQVNDAYHAIKGQAQVQVDALNKPADPPATPPSEPETQA